VNYYHFGGIRHTPLDPNYMLKFNYFQSIMQSFDSSCGDIMMFYSGYLVFNTLPAEIALFMYNYYYGLGEPFKFEDAKVKKKFSNINSHRQLAKVHYGYFVNSMIYGGVDIKKGTGTPTRDSSMALSKQFDLLGLDDSTEINLI
jgi:hypothetical protein